MKKRVSALNTAKRARIVEAGTDRGLKCISESVELKASRFFRERPIQRRGLSELS